MTTLCRSYLAVLSAYHLFTGVVSFAFPGFAMRFYKALYACAPEEQRQLRLVMKPWGALAIFAGLVGAFAAVEPMRYRGVIVGLCILLILRMVFRLGWWRELEVIGRIPPRRNLLSTACLALGALILGLWLLTAHPL